MSGVRRGLIKTLILGNVSLDKVKGAEDLKRNLRGFLPDSDTVNKPKT